MKYVWSPWQPTESRKFLVVVKPMKLEGGGFAEEGLGSGSLIDGGADHHRVVSREKTMVAVDLEMRWRGQLAMMPSLFHRWGSRRRYKERSQERFVRKGKPVVWDDDEFQNECDFTLLVHDHDHHHHHHHHHHDLMNYNYKFLPWHVSFKLSLGEYRAAKKSVIGKVLLNLAGMASKKSPSVTKLPLDLHIAGTITKATLSVLVMFMEVKEPGDPSSSLVRNSSWFGSMTRRSASITNTNYNYTKNDNEMISVSGSSETWYTTTESSSSSSSSSSNSDGGRRRKVGFFSWKRRRLSIRQGHTKVEPVLSLSGPLQGANSMIVPDGPKKQDAEMGATASNWESMKLTSRDGQTKLKSNVFFASFDQRSNKAAGESACTALVAVIAHWMQLHLHMMPTRTQFDNLIIGGSSEWRNLCGKEPYVNQFPNKHFDLETILRAGIRPITVSPQKSFVGFFNPEKFDSLKGAMSFDEIWTEIERHCQEDAPSRIYLVSWNDHFFVLKADANAYYIVDTLGERLYEGCNQAYILRFDENTSLTHRGNKENEEITYSGKNCCREFIRRFLAAIPLGELEEEEKKAAVPYYSLHNCLQIEFNFSTPLPSSTYLFSSAAAADPG